MTKSTKMLNLLKELSSGREVILKNYALESDLSERTLIRYIGELREFFGDEFITSTSKGSYICKNRELFKDFFLPNESIDEAEKLIDLLHIINPGFTKYLPNAHKRIDEKLTKELSEVFLIKGSPHENTPDLKIFGLVQKAIKFRRYIDIEYDGAKFDRVKPVKIIYSKGNWRVASIIRDKAINNGFLAMRLNFISSVSIKKETFYIDDYTLNFVKNSETFWDGYKVKSYKASVLVSPKTVKLFRKKNFFKSQKITTKSKNGWYKIEFDITSDDMLLILARRFFPDFIIISPKSIKDKFDDMIDLYRQNSLL